MAKYKPLLTKSEISFIDRLRKIRIEKHITQEELAKKAGVPRVFIAELEKYYKKPKKQYVSKIAAALEYPADKLDYFFKSAKFDKFIFEERTAPIPLSRDIIKTREEFERLSLESYIFLPYKLIDFISYQLQGNFYAYIMPDESMQPLIKKNDIVLIKFIDIDFKDLDERINNITAAAVNMKTGQEIIRNYNSHVLDKFIDSGRIHENMPDISLNPVNPEFISISFAIKNNKPRTWKIKGLVVAVISEKILIDDTDGVILKTFDM
ncbi:MAG: helix-turn-helix domain-containing protein [Deltaproteobacteria bacterium]|jgi:transcriptional regulator with XRE-family HTH domain|nr:helix-turn-helix domain-containing protein [Deltaproteobacteria bacterium]MCL5879593.1 helix-turn-helix domain-containing protein [Deltaproteobacteria bacterium]